jgi:hypothetical protein
VSGGQGAEGYFPVADVRARWFSVCESAGMGKRDWGFIMEKFKALCAKK